MASVLAKCPDNECILAFLRERQRELCGEWDGALTSSLQARHPSLSRSRRTLSVACTKPARSSEACRLLLKPDSSAFLRELP